jgi:hypothetical protein
MTLATERLDANPLEALVPLRALDLRSTQPFCERHVGGCTYHMVLNGREYRGRGNTEREAAWKLVESIARRQAEIFSCL